MEENARINRTLKGMSPINNTYNLDEEYAKRDKYT